MPMENRSVRCKDVDYARIVQLKDRNFTSAQIDNCNLQKWENSASAKLPFSSSLVTLKLHCNISEVPDDCLKTMNRLRFLDLSRNELITIPLGTFPLDNSIEQLNLSMNKIKFGRHDHTTAIFDNLKKLKQLDLSLNRIDNFESVFDQMENLQMLNISGNKLTRIWEGAFDFGRLKSLKEIDLSYNYILEISPKAFVSTANGEIPLESLDLHNNLLQHVEVNLFKNIQRLNRLNLINNRIIRLENNIFHGQHLSQFKQLSIGGNFIASFPQGIFNSLVNLEELYIANMQLHYMQNDLFVNNKKLKRLDISHNKITKLEATTFQPLTNLVYLNISNNDIVTFPMRMFESDTDEHSLSVVDFSYNKVENIEPDIFNMESLTHVHARGNRLKFLDPSAFATCAFPLLCDNRLVNFDLEFFEWVPNLERFEMTGNPWECKCFDVLLEFLNKRRIEYTKTGYFDGQQSTCIALNQFECKVDPKHFDKYFELYAKLNRLLIP